MSKPETPCLPECYSWIERDLLTDTKKHRWTHAPGCPNGAPEAVSKPVRGRCAYCLKRRMLRKSQMLSLHCSECGPPSGRPREKPPLILTSATVERFWSQVDKHGECWLWTGLTNEDGYGRFCIGQVVYRAHRVAWTILHGQIPAGKCVLHLCDVPACVRHLFLGTKAENSADMVAKKRQACARKLTPTDVEAIRSRKTSLTQEAKRYGVHITTIFDIRNRRTWNHL